MDMNNRKTFLIDNSATLNCPVTNIVDANVTNESNNNEKLNIETEQALSNLKESIREKRIEEAKSSGEILKQSDDKILINVDREKNISADNNKIREIFQKNVLSAKDLFFEEMNKEYGIDEYVLEYIFQKGVLYIKDDSVKIVDSFNNKEFDWSIDFLKNNNEKTSTVYVQGRDYKKLYYFNSLLEVMSFLSMSHLYKQDIKEVTFLVTSNQKSLKMIGDVSAILVYGDYGRSEVVTALSKLYKDIVKKIATLNNTINEDLLAFRLTENEKIMS